MFANDWSEHRYLGVKNIFFQNLSRINCNVLEFGIIWEFKLFSYQMFGRTKSVFARKSEHFWTFEHVWTFKCSPNNTPCSISSFYQNFTAHFVNILHWSNIFKLKMWTRIQSVRYFKFRTTNTCIEITCCAVMYCTFNPMSCCLDATVQKKLHCSVLWMGILHVLNQYSGLIRALPSWDYILIYILSEHAKTSASSLFAQFSKCSFFKAQTSY